MNNEHVPTIHDFDFDLICSYFLSFDRQGPGTAEITRRALEFVGPLTADSAVADLGCGTGGQTITLAETVPGRITGLDLYAPFVARLDEQARERGLSGRVRGVVGSMDAAPFASGSLDLIWSEGAIYNIGFEAGLRNWHRLLAPGGYVAVTENSWFTDERPAEIEAFWDAAYPEIDTIPAKVAALQRVGYEFVAAFALPQNCWTAFYDAQREPFARFAEQHATHPGMAAFIESQHHEYTLWQKYKAYYGYVFYIGRKL